jgi:hypothetical protein
VFEDCAVVIEAVQDYPTSTIRFHQLQGPKFDRAPTITITVGKGVSMASAEPLPGPSPSWRVTSEAFKTRTTPASIKIHVEGRTCEASLAVAPHGGRIVIVPDGPPVEIVRLEGGGLRLYVLEDKFGEKPMNVADLELVFVSGGAPRPLRFAPVATEAAVFEVDRFEAPAEDADVRLRLRLGGKTLETRVGSAAFLR